jgi:DNA-directed RNA polymerase subunit RPC12/RpoP
MAGIFTIIGDKFGVRGSGGGGGGDKLQYLLIGTLALAIIVALITVVTSFTGGPGKSKASGEAHFYDLETHEEFVFKPGSSSTGEMKYYFPKTDEWITLKPKQKPGKGGPMMDPMMMGPMMMGGPGMKMLNPKTGERTAVPMTKCPKCGKWFVSDYWKSDDPQAAMTGRIKCTYCGTDIAEYYRQKRKSRKK